MGRKKNKEKLVDPLLEAPIEREVTMTDDGRVHTMAHMRTEKDRFDANGNLLNGEGSASASASAAAGPSAGAADEQEEGAGAGGRLTMAQRFKGDTSVKLEKTKVLYCPGKSEALSRGRRALCRAAKNYTCSSAPQPNSPSPYSPSPIPPHLLFVCLLHRLLHRLLHCAPPLQPLAPTNTV